MAPTNKQVKVTPVVTHEGAPAVHINAEKQLRRSVMSCLLWEKEFYESGVEISQRLAELVATVQPLVVSKIAIEAREQMKLRHAPLFLVREMARHEKHKPFVEETLSRVIQRSDELAEFLAMYWSEGRSPIAHSVRRGLDKAIRKFNEYELAKYDRDKTVKLRDVFRMIRPIPANDEQKELWKRAVKGELATPDTWEVALSAKDGKSKAEKWTRLLQENKLGALALLRNLRNMEQEGVDRGYIRGAIAGMSTYRVLPFRFIAAARFAPHLEADLERKFFEVAGANKFSGRTVILVDVSSSMHASLSSKSDMTRLDAACGVAMVGREMADDVEVWSFSNQVLPVANRRGFSLRDGIISSQLHGGTELGKAVAHIGNRSGVKRLIVITDEQSHDKVTAPSNIDHKYVINVASNRNGVGYNNWTHIDGMSEAVFNYIVEAEKSAD